MRARTEADHLASRWLWPSIDVAGATLAIILFLYWATGFHFDRLARGPLHQADFGLIYLWSKQMFQLLHYPAHTLASWHYIFLYPPSGVAMFQLFALLPPNAAVLLWFGLQALSMTVVLWSSLKLSGAAHWRGALLLGAIALVLVDNALSWELRSRNVNMIYMALVMAGLVTRRAWLSGFLLGASAAFKLYSSMLLPLFLWRRELRRSLWIVIAFVFFWLVVPLAVFGPAGFRQLLSEWLWQVRYTASPEFEHGTHVITLRATIFYLLSAQSSSTTVLIVWRSAQAIWVLALLAYFATARRRKADEVPNTVLLADACVLLMAPLPLSTFFEPHHAVVLLPCYVLLLTAVVRGDWPSRVRWAAACPLALLIPIRQLFGELELLGGIYFVAFLLSVWALSLVRSSALLAEPLARERNDQPLMDLMRWIIIWRSKLRSG